MNPLKGSGESFEAKSLKAKTGSFKMLLTLSSLAHFDRTGTNKSVMVDSMEKCFIRA